MKTELEERLRTSIQTPATSVRRDWESITASADRRTRRSSRTFRLALVSFVAILGFTLVVNGSTGEVTNVDPATSPGGLEEAAPLTTPALVLAVVLTIGLTLMAVSALVRRPIHQEDALVGWRRWWPLLLLPPLLSAGLHTAWTFSVLESEGIIIAISLLSVPSVPVVIWLLAERVAEQLKRWRIASGVWISLGVACVLWTRWFIVDINARTQGSRLWPTEAHPDVLRSLEHPPDASWTADRIMVTELLFVVLIAISIGAVFRSVRSAPTYAAFIVPVVTWTMLGVYQFAAPLSFVFDYDIFFGDLVLGAAFANLTFVLPIDVVGSGAIALACLSMGLMLHGWGGPVRPAADDSEDAPVDETE